MPASPRTLWTAITATIVVLAAALMVLHTATAKGGKSAVQGADGKYLWNTQAKELDAMCDYCSQPDGGCYAFVPDGKVGPYDLDGCSYPPCRDVVRGDGGAPPEKKLACAACRAMCPGTEGAPKASPKPSPKR
jgi:hypothetical protein